jgi:hypothetical protein
MVCVAALKLCSKVPRKVAWICGTRPFLFRLGTDFEFPAPVASVRKPSVYAGKTNPPPFTMRLSDAFVNGKSVVLRVFSVFFPIQT